MSSITRYAPENVFPTFAGWPEDSIADHRRIIEALRLQDPAALTSHQMARARSFLRPEWSEFP
jgi:hypothetical protein